MESSLHGFIQALRIHGVRISTAELVDAAACAAVPGILATRSHLKHALRATLVTREADLAAFDSVFEIFFSLRPLPQPIDRETETAEEVPSGGTPGEDVDEMGLVDATRGTSPIDNASAGETDTRQFFDPDSLSQGHNLDEDADIADLASMTDEVSFSPSGAQSRGAGMKVQLDVSRSHMEELPGGLSPATGQAMDIDLSEDEEQQLMTWLGGGPAGGGGDEPLPDDLTGLLARLPEHLGEHLNRLAGLRRTAAAADSEPVVLDAVGARERDRLEQSLRRLADSLEGGLSQRKRPHHRGTVEPIRTARQSMRFDGVPFRPVTVSRHHERPRLVVLADVSLSVRATARFTLHVVHGLQATFSHVRSFAFVDEVVELTELFRRHPLEHALGLVFNGELLDPNASSDYGTVFEQFLDEHPNAVDRRTSVLVLGDGRSNGKDPGLEAYADIARRARTTVWLCPEPWNAWRLGSTAMPDYAELSDRVEIVRDLGGLERTSQSLAGA